MPFNPQTRIGDIVLEFPATMRIFESQNVDYCCGGHRSLADACGSYRSLFMGLRNLEEDLHLHIYLESHILFPRAAEMEMTRI